jgi:hypothetical protein
MYRFILAAFFLIVSCNIVRKITARIEEPHNALYVQKALFVYNVDSKRVYLTNPTYTRCYYLKGKYYAEKWAPGDTMIIENNLEDFYDLRYDKSCNW